MTINVFWYFVFYFSMSSTSITKFTFDIPASWSTTPMQIMRKHNIRPKIVDIASAILKLIALPILLLSLHWKYQLIILKKFFFLKRFIFNECLIFVISSNQYIPQPYNKHQHNCLNSFNADQKMPSWGNILECKICFW